MAIQEKFLQEELLQVEFFDLKCARKQLSQISAPVILINAPGTIRSLGALVIDEIFKTLQQEFDVKRTIMRVDDDLAGLFMLTSLGYKDIIYSGNASAAKKILRGDVV